MFTQGRPRHPHISLLRNLLILFLFLTLLLVFLWHQRISRGNGEYIVETKSGKELALEAFKFLEVLHRPDNIIQGIECKNNESCTSIKSVNPPAAIAWQIQANAKLYHESKSSKYLENISKLFEMFDKFKKHPLLSLQLEVNLSQLIEGFKASRNFDVLRLIVPTLQDIRTQVNTKGPLSIVAKDQMVASLIAGELADFYGLLGDPTVIEYLKNNWLPKKYTDSDLQAYRDSFKIASSKIIDELHASGEMTQAGGLAIPILEPQDFSCFVQLAKSKLYNATKDAPLLNQIIEYFDKADFESKDTGDVRFNVIQPALACAETLKNIITVRPELEKDLHAIISKFILSRFDYSRRPICTGDNGFLGSMGEGFTCAGTLKLISDSAWAVSILADLKMQFDISSKRIANDVGASSD
ncbi:MAG: hypothetical protein GYA55_04135 [SAR324 cluster bacterium]|uniref:Uncharacterized protein n=1 Tax=SAR324 cluster bacterium TaxID=2024889 RepID=A0A7X9IJ77_9DELT|nr:hypothetical protein [SAR324 cluster bacterium]